MCPCVYTYWYNHCDAPLDRLDPEEPPAPPEDVPAPSVALVSVWPSHSKISDQNEIVATAEEMSQYEEKIALKSQEYFLKNSVSPCFQAETEALPDLQDVIRRIAGRRRPRGKYSEEIFARIKERKRTRRPKLVIKLAYARENVLPKVSAYKRREGKSKTPRG